MAYFTPHHLPSLDKCGVGEKRYTVCIRTGVLNCWGAAGVVVRCGGTLVQRSIRPGVLYVGLHRRVGRYFTVYLLPAPTHPPSDVGNTNRNINNRKAAGEKNDRITFLNLPSEAEK